MMKHSMMKHTLSAAALAALLAVPAFAQQQPQPMETQPQPMEKQLQPTEKQLQPMEKQQQPMENTGSATQGSQSSMPQPSATGAQRTGFVQNQNADEWRSSKLIGASIYGPDNSSIGEISDMIIGSDGKIKAAVVSVGGFLGVGSKSVAVPFDALNVRREPNSSAIGRITVTYNKDQFKNAPTFAYYQASGKAQTTGSGTSGSMNKNTNSNTMKK
jgi:hypothetical protein